MKPAEELSSAECAGIKFVCTDIDDTLTFEGRLVREAFDALWNLHDEGFFIIPVTGRPAGWCDCIIRQWPVDAVVGENGGFAFYRKDGREEILYHPEGIRLEDRKKLFDALTEEILSSVPGVSVAKDQPYRLFDTAFDFKEEADLNLDAARRIQEIAESYEAHAKISSIHVNVWFGNYDKLGMIQYLLEEIWGRRSGEIQKEVLFCGDSPNDEPMFSFFPLSFGVGNIEQFSGSMTHLPAYRASRSHGEGFQEIAEIIIKKRNEAY